MFDFASPGFVASYDELPLWSAPFGLLLLEAVPLRRGSRVLDVGCGTGFPLLELAERLGTGSEVHGIDPWEAAARRARAKIEARGIENAHVHVGGAGALPFADGFFDLVVSNLGINNFDDPELVLRECRRVCRLGGELVLSTNLQGTMREVYDALELAVADVGLADATARVARLVLGRTTVEDARELLASARFETTHVRESSFQLRFASGAAVLRHSFMRIGFVDGWAGAAPEAASELLLALERRLDRVAEASGGLALTVPMACLSAVAV
jgi:ubiquinone/menaquinone biosynthesis C-methylase UbiE